jgi:hypothetical protein
MITSVNQKVYSGLLLFDNYFFQRFSIGIPARGATKLLTKFRLKNWRIMTEKIDIYALYLILLHFILAFSFRCQKWCQYIELTAAELFKNYSQNSDLNIAHKNSQLCLWVPCFNNLPNNLTFSIFNGLEAW